MTTITFYCDSNDYFFGFECEGHSGYARSGKDIVCAGISTLTCTFVNSVEKLLHIESDVISDERLGFLKVTVKDYKRDDLQLLFNSLRLGLNDIQESFPKNCKLANRRCKP